MTNETSAGSTAPLIARKPTSQPLPDAQREAILASPGFGRYFTDHMVTIEWTEGRGWHDAQLVPYGPIQLDPATMSLHYGQEIFEGLKAYRRSDGSIATFRPEMNASRFQRSAARLAMPGLPDDMFLAAIEALVEQDQQWVPGHDEMSLYLRPFMFSTEVGLGVKPASSYLFMLIASPAGAGIARPSPLGAAADPRGLPPPPPPAAQGPRLRRFPRREVHPGPAVAGQMRSDERPTSGVLALARSFRTLGQFLPHLPKHRGDRFAPRLTAMAEAFVQLFKRRGGEGIGHGCISNSYAWTIACCHSSVNT